MNVGLARKAATQWVHQYASTEPWFQGAYFSGSTIYLTDETPLPPSSDIDIVIVTSEAEPPLKLGKFVYRGALLEVTYLSRNELASVEEVLSNYHLAGGFRFNTIISDPTGYLQKLQSGVSRSFGKRQWVLRRCENVRFKIETGLSQLDVSAPLHDRITGWLFPTGVTTHLLLVAALRNPTVRLRYPAVREVLNEYGHADFYNDLLGLLGCTHLSPERTEHHVSKLAQTFDAAAAAAKTPFFFSTDITADARPIVIDGSLELIKSGLHREAIFWMVATFARCHKILAADAPINVQQAHLPAFEAMISDLGIDSKDDLLRRAEDVLHFLPKVWEAAEFILSANPDIV